MSEEIEWNRCNDPITAARRAANRAEILATCLRRLAVDLDRAEARVISGRERSLLDASEMEVEWAEAACWEAIYDANRFSVDGMARWPRITKDRIQARQFSAAMSRDYAEQWDAWAVKVDP